MWLAVSQLYLIEWIFTLFAKSLPDEPVSWIWDHVLLLGDEHIFQSALGLLNLLESKLLAMDDLGEIASVLKDLMHSPILSEVRASFKWSYCFDLCGKGYRPKTERLGGRRCSSTHQLSRWCSRIRTR